jgi:hypothetical protein
MAQATTSKIEKNNEIVYLLLFFFFLSNKQIIGTLTAVNRRQQFPVYNLVFFF